MVKSWITIIVLALTVSFDGFGAGVTYGARKIRVPLLSVVIIAVCSGSVMYISMQFSTVLVHAVSMRMAEIVGAAILTTIGFGSVIQAVKQRRASLELSSPMESVKNVGTKRRNTEKRFIFLEVLRTPLRADIDRSGNISAFEAVLLGSALSLDALGAGIGAALVGLPSFWTAFAIGTTCGLCLYIGMKMGYHFASKKWMRQMTMLPGLILIGLGVLRFF